MTPGRHDLRLGLRDSARASGFDYESELAIELGPGQNFVIDFHPEFGGFRFVTGGPS